VPKQTHLRPLIPIRPSISAYSPRTTVQTMRGPKPRHRHIVVKRTDVQDDGRTVPRTGRRAGTPCWRILPRVIGAKVPIGWNCLTKTKHSRSTATSARSCFLQFRWCHGRFDRTWRGC